jgi:hypothetical protein
MSRKFFPELIDLQDRVVVEETFVINIFHCVTGATVAQSV